MDVVIADRIQFAFTIMFHYLFPITTMGLAPFVALYTIEAARGDREAARAAAFWTKIFAINFAIGVVTGIPMEFQFGTNWAVFSAVSGAVIGQPLAMEGIYAFFLESIFLGVLLYGKGRVAPVLHAASAVIVWLGSWLSGFFIVATDAWMQHPVGYELLANGRIASTSLAAVLLSTFAWWQYLHVLCAALVAGGFVVAGIGAYYLLSNRENALGRRFVDAGVIVALIFSLLVIFPTGDRNGDDVTAYQPVKLAAMEGLFASTKGAPLAIIGMPDTQNKTLIDPIFVPDVLSFLAYGNFNANVQGLNAYATELWPPVELTYYAYHVMVGLGTIFAGIAVLAGLALWRGRIFTATPILWLLLLAMPFPYIANEAGWVTTEVGRQPWIIYGIMRTAQGISPTVVTGETIFTLIGFAGMYFLLGVLFLYLVLREIAIGP
ncbi:MAG TPA: cytochrome ubiquinol oxidase subunit I [Candidatus Baltobacteraceae bacterium]|nr:cytochrome ubiquinol oxidase subunit I [Candidatus Baltobacteraceae bacterium]